MRNTNKKGFTIVELVVVVAVIAILAAVLIPTFSGVIAKANLSADKQAVAQMNKYLAMESVESQPESLSEALDILAKNGYKTTLDPLCKGYRFGFYKAENAMVLVDEQNKVVFPKEYAGLSASEVLMVTVFTGAEHKVTEDMTFTSDANLGNDWFVVENNVTFTISDGKTISANGYDSAIKATAGATLTIKGNGNVEAVCDTDPEDGLDYAMAIWAKGANSKVVIEGGKYTNVVTAETTANDKHFDLIYSSNGGTVEIKGGTFKCATPGWTLNCKNNTNSKIIVSGGEFFEFNPASTDPMPDGRTLVQDGITVADGYKVISETRADGTWYIVVAE